MKYLAIVGCIVASSVWAQDAKPKTHQVQLNGHTFTLPEGLTIELAAKAPLADRPIVAAFDDRGRLYVADSSGINDKVAEQVKNPSHRIMRLEDTNGDGVFDKSTVFADKMMFPEGILWHRGHIYVAAPPHIWKLTDHNDDGQADQRDIWFDGKTLTGCANDLHGPYLGPDGYLYWCKGAFAKQTYKLPNGKEFTTRASHIFRAKPNGTHIEPVMTGGMDNPVDCAFLPNGERFFTTTFFQHPALGKRDGIVHAVYGGIYGKDHDVIYDADHVWTSPNLMPVLTHLGPAAPCGLHCYESDRLGKDYQRNLFACQFNLRKVSRHVLVPEGSAYKTIDSDLVVSDQQDFHPTDVIEDADGSLLIVDTGGWYKLCCPSSQLVKADVLGAIYRVRRTDAKKLRDPWGKDLAVDQAKPADLVVWFLNHESPAVRNKVATAILEQARTNPRLVQQIIANAAGTIQPEKQARLYWLVMQIDHPAARLALYESKWGTPTEESPDGWVDVALVRLHGIALNRDRNAVKALRTLIAADSPMPGYRDHPAVRRAIVTALGRIGDKSAIPELIDQLTRPMDRQLEHAITYALIEIGDAQGTAEGLKINSPIVRRCVLTALDQMKAKLEPGFVLPMLQSDDTSLKETAVWIVGRHPEWANDVATVFKQRLGAKAFTAKDRDELAPLLSRFAKTTAVQTLLALGLNEAGYSLEAQRTILLAMERSGVKDLPNEWTIALTKALGESTDLRSDVLRSLRVLPTPKTNTATFVDALNRIITTDTSVNVRLSAMAIVPNGLKEVSAEQFKFLLAAIDRDRPVAQRGLAADVLAKAKLSSVQFHELIDHLKAAGPLEVDRLLGAFVQTTDDAVGKHLVKALNTPELRPSVRVDSLKERLKKYPPTVHEEAEKLYLALNAELAQQSTRLEAMLKNLPAGDVRRGQAVFNNQKNSCIACHTIGYVGGKIGPDLTRIGGIRNERDLLEAVLYPSASFVRSYEPLTVRTLAGQTYNGILKKDAPDEIILIVAADKEVTISRKDIDEIQPGKVSIMPAGLDKQLTPQELADLIAFLKACR